MRPRARIPAPPDIQTARSRAALRGTPPCRRSAGSSEHPFRAAPYAWPLSLASDSASRSANQGGHQDRGQQRGDQRVFDGVIDPVVPRLHALADEPDRIDEGECLVDEADLFAVDVLSGRCFDDVMDDPD